MTEFEQKLKSAEALAARGKMSRREFVQFAAALGIAIPVASSLFSKVAKAEDAKKGGALVIGMEGGSASDSTWPLGPRLW